jgi:hypothetical protein
MHNNENTQNSHSFDNDIDIFSYKNFWGPISTDPAFIIVNNLLYFL